MKALKFPLIPFTIFIALGILIGFYTPFNIDYFSIAFISTLIGFCVSYQYVKASKNTFVFGFFTYLLAFQVGIILQYSHNDCNDQLHYKNNFSDQQFYLIEGVVKNVIKPSLKKHNYLLNINSINGKTIKGKILVHISKDSSVQFVPGNELVLKAKLIALKSNYNPYRFDYSEYLKKQNIFHHIYIDKDAVLKCNQTYNFDYYLHKTRHKLLSYFDDRIFDTKTKNIINALLFGQRIYLDETTIKSYSNAGVIHVLAISGLHVGILFLMINFFLQPLERLKKGSLFKLIIIISFLWFFAFLSGLSPSVTRAVLMFTILSIGSYLNKQNTTINTVACSALILLCYNPLYIFDVGFQLSYSAVISIVLLNPFFKYFYFSKNKIVRYFIDLVLVSLAAQIGVLPLSILYFNQFPVLFLVANIIVIPLTTLILFLGLLLLFFAMFSKFIANAIGEILSFCIEMMNDFIHWFSKFNSFLIKDISFNLLLCLLSYIFISAFVFSLYTRKIKNITYVLLAFLILQLSYMYVKTKENTIEELIVFNSKSSLITIKKKDCIGAYSNNPEGITNDITRYKTNTFCNHVTVEPLNNVLLFNNSKVLIVDSLATYKLSQKPDVIVLTQGTRVNLERLIEVNKPKIIIADNSNSKYKVERWKKTCLKAKVPFHSTYEKGLYKIIK